MHSFTRREFLKAAAASGICSAPLISRAQVELLPYVLPTIVAGLVSLWISFRDADQRAREHEASMELQKTSLKLQLAQFNHTVDRAEKDSQLVLLTHLMANNQELQKLVLASHPFMQQLVVEKGERISSALSLDADGTGQGTKLSLRNGEIMLRRGSSAGLFHNEEATVLGEVSQQQGDPIAIPTTKLYGNFSVNETMEIKKVLAKRKGADPSKVALIAYRDYSRRKEPTGHRDMSGISYAEFSSGSVPRVQFAILG